MKQPRFPNRAKARRRRVNETQRRLPFSEQPPPKHVPLKSRPLDWRRELGIVANALRGTRSHAKSRYAKSFLLLGEALQKLSARNPGHRVQGVLDLDFVRQQGDSNPHIAVIVESFLVKATRDANDLVRFRATQSLRYYASEKPTVKRLIELTRDAEEVVRKKACWAMGYSALPEAKKALQELAREKNNSTGVRSEARKAIRRWESLQAQRSGKTIGLFQE